MRWFVSIALAAVCASCFGWEMPKLNKIAEAAPKPTATMERFDIKQISLRDITFTFDVAVHNPYPVALTLDGVDLDLSVEKQPLFKTTTSKGFSVAAKGKQTSSFDVTLTYGSIMKIIADYSARDYLVCDIDALVKIPLPKVIAGLPPSVNLPFKLSQKIPAIKPKVSIANFAVTMPTESDVRAALTESTSAQLKAVDAKKAQGMFASLLSGKPVAAPVIKPADIDLKIKVLFDIVLENQAKAPIDFSSLSFQFFINSNAMVAGETSSIEKRGNTIVMHVVNEFSSKSLSTSVLSVFKSGTGAFTVTGSTTMDLPPAVLSHPVKLSFSENGSFKVR
ncbi:MAG: LEA type 2 family protein [Spirochaetota bacterium]